MVSLDLCFYLIIKSESNNFRKKDLFNKINSKHLTVTKQMQMAVVKSSTSIYSDNLKRLPIDLSVERITFLYDYL